MSLRSSVQPVLVIGTEVHFARPERITGEETESWKAEVRYQMSGAGR